MSVRDVAPTISRASTRGVALSRLFDPMLLVWIVVVAILVLLTVDPILALIRTSFVSDDAPGLTIQNYTSVYGNSANIRPIGTTVLYAGCTALLAAFLAIPIAWAVSRSDMPFKGFIRLLVLGAFMMPSYLGAVAWILLAGPNSGWLNKMWMAVTGADRGLVNIYSFGGLVFVTALYSFTYVFIFTSDAFDRLSSELEEASNILGAGPLRTTLQISLPLAAPAIVGGMIITFLDTFALFGTPAILALPARINVMTLQLWQFFQFPVNEHAAAAYALPMISITCVLFLGQRLYFGRKGYVTLSGKTSARQLIPLGRYRWVAFGYCLGVGALAVILPLAALSQAAFTKAWGKGFSLGNLTLDNFRYILFNNVDARQSMINTVTYSAVAATAAIVLAVAVAYIVIRRLVPFAGALTMLCMSPYVVPGIVMAIGFYTAYALPPLSLYGTATILILAFTSRFMPIAYVNCAAGVRSINVELEEAVRILGGSRARVLSGVVLPLMRKSLAGSWILIFIPAIRELSSALFLVSANTRVLSIVILDYTEGAQFEILAALGFLLFGATIVVVSTSYFVVGRDFLLRKT